MSANQVPLLTMCARWLHASVWPMSYVQLWAAQNQGGIVTLNVHLCGAGNATDAPEEYDHIGPSTT